MRSLYRTKRVIMNAIIKLLFLVLIPAGSYSQAAKSIQEPKKAVTSITYTNPFKNTDWKSSSGVPFETANQENYSFSKYDPSLDMMYWGNFIHFKGTTFTTHYSAPCGNDCFTTVTGEYRTVGDHLLEIKVLGINYSGFCGKESVTGFQFQTYYTFVLDEKQEKAEMTKKSSIDKAGKTQK